MLLLEKEIRIPRWSGNGSVIKYMEQELLNCLQPHETAIRFVVTETDESYYHCEVGVLTDNQTSLVADSIFQYSRRGIESTNTFNAALIVPTGIGAEIGGHAGDAGPVARLLASACDTLITHPNVVNASDINELPDNGLYVEGSVLTQLLMGAIGLQKVRANRVMLIADKHKEHSITELYINAVSAARACLGLECPRIVEMEPPIRMRARYSTSGTAVGRIESLERICKVLEKHKGEYDAVALASVVDVPSEFHKEYFASEGKMVNPWGGVEAMLTHALTMLFGVQTAHAPMMENKKIINTFFGVVDPRMSAEAVSNCYVHCVLKGLHRSPRIIKESSEFHHPDILSASDVSCVVIPDGCVGLPTLAALEQGIPVIAVRENKNCMKNDLAKLPFGKNKLFVVDNYFEAVGIMTALKAGVAVSSIRRPLAFTEVVTETVEEEQLIPEAHNNFGAKETNHFH